MLHASQFFHKNGNNQQNSQYYRKAPENQKLIPERVMLCQCNSLYHRFKFQSKRQNNQIGNHNNLCSLQNSHRKNSGDFSAKTDNIRNQDNTAGYHKINYKIPVICPLEHSKKHCCQKNMRHQKLSEPEISQVLFFRFRSSATNFFKPRIKKPHQKCHKHHIHHMSVKISQNK